MNGFDGAKRIMNGTYGEVWLDGEQVGECYGLQLKVSVTKEDVFIPGKMMQDTKIKSTKGTGVMKLYKANSRMAIKLAADMQAGRDPRFTIISKLDDPDNSGSERYAVRGVSFDDLILADWEAGVLGKTDAPFTFTGYDPLDLAEVR